MVLTHVWMKRIDDNRNGGKSCAEAESSGSHDLNFQLVPAVALAEVVEEMMLQ